MKHAQITTQQFAGKQIILCLISVVLIAGKAFAGGDPRNDGKEISAQTIVAQGDSVAVLLCPDGFKAICTALPQDCAIDPRKDLDKVNGKVLCNGKWLPLQKSKPVLK